MIILEKREEIFSNFLDGLQTRENFQLLESVRKAFNTLYESEEEKIQEKTLTFKFRNSEDSILRLMELFKGNQRGTLLLDPDGDLKEPVAAFVRPETKGEYRTRIYEYDVTEDEEEKYKNFKLTVKSNKKEDLDNTMDNFKKLFEDIASLGNCGHSYSIKFVPNSNQAKIREIGWDGDGSDYIDTDTIKVS